AKRARLALPLRLPLALRILAERDGGQYLAGRLTRLCGRERLGIAKRDATGAAAVGRSGLGQPHLAAACAQAQAKTGRVAIPKEMVVLADWQRESGDGSGVESHGPFLGSHQLGKPMGSQTMLPCAPRCGNG